jgi:hypothetical protein
MKHLVRLVLAAALLLPAVAAHGNSVGQTVYLPAYSHIYHGIKTRPFLLTVTCSVRNVSPAKRLTITSVDYYDDRGKLVRRFLDKPRELAPLASAEFVIEEGDESGGAGANFLISWQAAAPVQAPVVEAVMIGSASSQGISFLTEGRVIEEAETGIGGR